LPPRDAAIETERLAGNAGIIAHYDLREQRFGVS
jgi:hypothetical protein